MFIICFIKEIKFYFKFWRQKSSMGLFMVPSHEVNLFTSL